MDANWRFVVIHHDCVMFNVNRSFFKNLKGKSEEKNPISIFSSKVPQILTIHQQKSAAGISLKALVIETISYTVSTLYNFTNGYRILNYFEYIILLGQNYLLILIILFYRKQINQKFLVTVIIYSIIGFLFSMHILPKAILTFLIVRLISNLFKLWNYLTNILNFKPGTLPMSATSKILQLLEIIKTKDSSSISEITWFISAFTNASKFN